MRYLLQLLERWPCHICPIGRMQFASPLWSTYNWLAATLSSCSISSSCLLFSHLFRCFLVPSTFLVSTYSHLFHCFLVLSPVLVSTYSQYNSVLMFTHLLPLPIPYILLFPLLACYTYNWLQLCPHVPSPPLVYLFSSVSLFSCSNYFSCLYLFPSVSLFSYSIYFFGLYLFLVTSLFSCSITLCLLILYIFLFPLLVWSTYNWLQLCPHVPSPLFVYLFPSLSLFSCYIYCSCLYLFPFVSLVFCFPVFLFLCFCCLSVDALWSSLC